jgi:proline iminopeptidase
MMTLPDWHGHGAELELAGGGRLYYEVEGDGPPVVLVSGGPGTDHSHYHPWFSALAGTHAVVYYDHPGTGRSPAPEDCYTVPGYARAIEQLRVELGVERLCLVGLSFGGLPAVAYAVRHPDRLAALVLSNAHVNAAGWQQGNIDHVNETLRVQFPEVWEQILSMREEGRRSLDIGYQELVGQALPRLEWANPDGHPRLLADRPFTLAAYEGFVGDDPEWTVGGSLQGYDPPLEQVAAPTLVLSGRYDGLSTPALAHEYAARIPGSRWHVFESSGHRPWAEQPAAYVDVVREFLTEEAAWPASSSS